MSDFERTYDNIEEHISEVSKEPTYWVFTSEYMTLNASLKHENQTITHIKGILNAV